MIGHGALREMFPHAQRDLDVFAVALRLDTADIHDGRGVVCQKINPCKVNCCKLNLRSAHSCEGSRCSHQP